MVKTVLTALISFLTLGNLFSQTFEMSAKVIIEKDEQYLKIILTCEEQMWFDLGGMNSNFIETQDTSKLFEYDSLNVNYEARLEDTVNSIEYYDLSPSILFFLHNGKYYRYSLYSFTSLNTDEKDQLLSLEESHPWEMMETYKRRVYKIPLSIDHDILGFRPEKIYFQAVVSYLPDIEEANVKNTSIEAEGKVKYRMCWKKGR